MTTFLIDHVSVLPHYQRSIRFDSDIGKADVLNSFVMTSSGVTTLSELSQFIEGGNQAAFTWTGPYGTGKSALAVFLAALADRDSKIRKVAREMLPSDSQGELVNSVFGDQGRKWKVIPVTGDRRGLFELINDGLKKAGFAKSGPPPNAADRVVKRVEEASDYFKRARPLIIVDELGKCLESSLLGGGDINHFQEIAELFARSSVRPVFIGILHQSFEYYSSRMSSEVRDEWKKVQGRFVDLSLKTTTDEVVGLAARAVTADYTSAQAKSNALSVYQTLRVQRPNLEPQIAEHLRSCWPLHPLSVLLISALSRKSFTQAQRSLFGFLSSNDPAGFRDFLKHTAFDEAISYDPSHVFDYVAANFDQALNSSTSEARRWAIIKEGLSRVESKFGDAHRDVFKTIAVIELLREPQALLASKEVLNILFGERLDIEQMTKDLAALSVIVFRRYQSCWALYAGSDFDLEGSLKETQQGLSLTQRDLDGAIEMSPIVAKLHYSETGSLRWLSRSVAEVSSVLDESFSVKLDGAIASFVLLISDSDEKLRALVDESTQLKMTSKYERVIFGAPKSEQARRIAIGLYQSLIEVNALEKILKSSSQLDSDDVARRLVREQLETARLYMHSLVESLTEVVTWVSCFSGDLTLRKGETLSGLASRVAFDLFPQTPHFLNELLNRDGVSTSAAKARKELMNSMLLSENSYRLGLSGWPAEAGLYESILRRTRHHVEKSTEVWIFECSSVRPDEFGELWKRTDAFLQCLKPKTAIEVYKYWQQPPFGIKLGLAPLLLWLYLIARREQVVFYLDGVFQPQIAPINADELLRKPGDFAVRLLKIAEEEQGLLTLLADEFAKENGELVAPDILNVARAVVREFLVLPTWVKRTSRASVPARKIRTEVLKASDPNQLLFVVLPNVVGSSDPNVIVGSLLSALNELRALLPNMAGELWNELMKTLGVTSLSATDFEKLKSRASDISDVLSHAGLKTLVPRLLGLSLAQDDIVEQKFSLICMAAGKTDRDFFDHDIDVARQVFREWALEFRKTELLKRLTDGSRHRVALTFGVGVPDAQSSVLTIDVDRSKLGRALHGHPEILELFEGMSKEDQALALVRLSQALFKETVND